MCHFLPFIAFKHAFFQCYGKITTKDVCRSMRKAFFLIAVEKSRKSQHCLYKFNNLWIFQHAKSQFETKYKLSCFVKSYIFSINSDERNAQGATEICAISIL